MVDIVYRVVRCMAMKLTTTSLLVSSLFQNLLSTKRLLSSSFRFVSCKRDLVEGKSFFSLPPEERAVHILYFVPPRTSFGATRRRNHCRIPWSPGLPNYTRFLCRKPALLLLSKCISSRFQRFDIWYAVSFLRRWRRRRCRFDPDGSNCYQQIVVKPDSDGCLTSADYVCSVHSRRSFRKWIPSTPRTPSSTSSSSPSPLQDGWHSIYCFSSWLASIIVQDICTILLRKVELLHGGTVDEFLVT